MKPLIYATAVAAAVVAPLVLQAQQSGSLYLIRMQITQKFTTSGRMWGIPFTATATIRETETGLLFVPSSGPHPYLRPAVLYANLNIYFPKNTAFITGFGVNGSRLTYRLGSPYASYTPPSGISVASVAMGGGRQTNAPSEPTGLPALKYPEPVCKLGDSDADKYIDTTDVRKTLKSMPGLAQLLIIGKDGKRYIGIAKEGAFLIYTQEDYQRMMDAVKGTTTL